MGKIFYWIFNNDFVVIFRILPMEKDLDDVGCCIKYLDLLIHGNNNVTTTSTQEHM